MQFKDKKNRIIFLKESHDTIYALHGETQVGCIQFVASESPVGYGDVMVIAYPEQMHIIEGYQRNGIGTEIIKYAKEIYDEVIFAEDTGCGGNTDKIHYTSDGLQFKNYCESKSITSNTQCYEYDENEY